MNSAPLLHQHRIPLVFLEACQSAQAEQASESVASRVARSAWPPVVAMSHSVLVETSRRFVEAFYGSLAKGSGWATRCSPDSARSSTTLARPHLRRRRAAARRLVRAGAVPREGRPAALSRDPGRADPRRLPKRASNAASARCRARWPPVFVGRSRELLALERLLRADVDNNRARGAGAGQAARGQDRTGRRVRCAGWCARNRFRRAASSGGNPPPRITRCSMRWVASSSATNVPVAAFDDLEPFPWSSVRSSATLPAGGGQPGEDRRRLRRGHARGHWPRRCTCARGHPRALCHARGPGARHACFDLPAKPCPRPFDARASAAEL